MHSKIASSLDDKHARSCGLCGTVRQLTKAHMPPQCAGNDEHVLRARDMARGEMRQPGQWHEGGVWVRGLCESCNGLSSNKYDPAYADFAQAVRAALRARKLLLAPADVPPVPVAPGLVARCVLIGMFAVHPRLRLIAPQLARDLTDRMHPLRWPSDLQLKVAHTTGRHAILTSGIGRARFVTRRETHFSFADVAFPPLIWSLVSRENDHPVTATWGDASSWSHYSDDVTGVDLRNVLKRFPTAIHPHFRDQDEWVEFMTERDSETPSVTVLGRLPAHG